MRILSITGPDLSNGIGNRITIWVSGCTHKCPGCHNVNAHDYNIGTDISIEDNYNKIYNLIITNLNKPYIKGITLTNVDITGKTKNIRLFFIDSLQNIRNGMINGVFPKCNFTVLRQHGVFFCISPQAVNGKIRMNVFGINGCQ